MTRTYADRSELLAVVEDDLRHEHDRLQEEAAALEEDTVDLSPMDLVDQAADMTRARARERRYATVLDRLREVREALERAADGSFGRCDECGGEIDGARLRARPMARSCREHAGW